MIPLMYTFFHKKILLENNDFIHTASYSLILSFLALVVTIKMIPVFMQMNHAKGIFGIDINKVQDRFDLTDPGRKEM
jgi:hypothetical protein